MHGIVARAGLSAAELDAVRDLAARCAAHDGATQKLNWELMRDRAPGETGDLLVYDGAKLIGYAALDGFTGAYETTALVDPAHRRQGIGRRLLDAVVVAARARSASSLLLVCEHGSVAGQAFVAAQGARLRYAFSEYHMQRDRTAPLPPASRAVQLRPATTADAPAIARIRAAAFTESEAESRAQTDAQLAEPGSTVYLADVSGAPVGTVCLLQEPDGVYLRALAVLPAQQGHGYGRAILTRAVELAGDRPVALDVATENAGALGLYERCGFVVTSRYDYYACVIVD